MTVAIALNVIQFWPIEQGAGPYYQALGSYSSSSVVDIVPEHMTGVGEIYGLPFDLADEAGDARVIVFPASNLARDARVRGMVPALVEEDYDPDLDSETAEGVRSHVVANGVDRFHGAYEVAVIEADPETLVLVRYDGGLVFADQRLLPVGMSREIDGG